MAWFVTASRLSSISCSMCGIKLRALENAAYSIDISDWISILVVNFAICIITSCSSFSTFFMACFTSASSEYSLAILMACSSIICMIFWVFVSMVFSSFCVFSSSILIFSSLAFRIFKSVWVAKPVKSENACDNQCLFLLVKTWMSGGLVGWLSS